MTPDKSPQGAQDEALRLAALFELYAIDYEPDGWPAIRQRELTAAAAELRRLHARVQELERAAAHAEMAAETEARYADERCAKAAADEREACALLAERRFLADPSAAARAAHRAACQSIAIDVRARGAEPDLARLTARGAVAWAGVDAQALREGRMPHNTKATE